MSGFLWICCLLSGFAANAQSPRATQAGPAGSLPAELPISGYGLLPALGGLTFSSPVGITTPPGETNRVFIVERTGCIVVVTNLAGPSKTVFLDLRSKTYSDYLEAGLLGLAFHPGYSSNGFLYVFRSLIRNTPGNPNTLHQQISRFQVDPADPNQALPGSESILIAQADSSPEHNGGALEFGPDGYLYASFGDNGPPLQDRSGQPQAIDVGFFGGIIRIDVDGRPGNLAPNPHPSVGSGYSIPSDNPFVGSTTFAGLELDPTKVRTEFYAVGFRNPWRMSFDPFTGNLLCGDVGASDWEEVDLVQKGGNYGWPYLEGTAGTPAPGFESIPPLLAYPHGYNSKQGLAVVGGIVYSGLNIPSLRGSYVFGDYGSGSIWSLQINGGQAGPWNYLTCMLGTSAFGRDPNNGDVLIANHTSGAIQRLVYVPPESVTSIPATLLDTGVFSDTAALQVAPGFVPYSVNTPFWSDGALKSRWFALPNTGAKIQFQSDTNWLFPAGSVWVKHFELMLTNGVPESAHRVETRVLVKTPDGVYGLSYRWARSLTNATLVPESGWDDTFVVWDGGNSRTQTWHYPSRSQCQFCHTPQAGYALAFNTAQLNRASESNPGQNQLLALEQFGCFSDPVLPDMDGLRKLSAATDPLVPLGYRARSYLAANCSQCHQPGAPAGDTWDARLTTPLSLANLVNVAPQFNFGDTSSIPSRVLAPGLPEASTILRWMGQRGAIQMPPTGTTVVDTNGVQLITDWINSFPPAPWLESTPGTNVVDGYTATSEGGFTLGASAISPNNGELPPYGLYRSLDGTAQLVARLTAFHPAAPAAKAGLMCRASLDPAAPFLAIWQGGDGQAYFQRRGGVSNDVETVNLGTAVKQPWFRLARQESNIVACLGADRGDWQVVGVMPCPQDQPFVAGFAVAPSAQAAFTTATFQDVSYSSVRLVQPTDGANFVSPGVIRLAADVVSSGSAQPIVEFLADSQTLGTATGPSYTFEWRDPTAGVHEVRARMSDGAGTVLVSPGAAVQVAVESMIAQFQRRDGINDEIWASTNGSAGTFQPGAPSTLHAPVAIEVKNLDPTAASDEPAVQGTPPAATWFSPRGLLVRVHLDDAQLHQVALLFADTTGSTQRVETVRAFDATSGTLLDPETIQLSAGAQSLQWTMRGDIRIEISELSGLGAVLSGVAVAPATNDPPNVVLHSSASSPIQLPSEIVLEAAASDPDGTVRRVEFFDGTGALGSVTQAPFRFSWSTATVGSHVLTARAFDDLGAYTDSAPVPLEITSAPPAVEFIGVDPVTAGDWAARYARYVIPGVLTNAPSEAAIRIEKGDVYIWPQITSAPQALQTAAGDARVPATWFGNELRVDVAMLDGSFHPLALYFLDWDGEGRVETVSLLDPATGRSLDTKTISSFGLGQYYLWNVRGSIQIQVVPWNMNAVLSGLFFDPLDSDSLALRWLPAQNQVALALRGPPGRDVLVSFSPDMTRWSPVRTGTLTPAGVLILSNLLQNAISPGFYRAELIPLPATPAP